MISAGPHDLNSLVERLAKLESQHRRLKQLGIIALLLFSVTMFLYTASFSGVRGATPPQTVEAERFVLKDTTGKTRAVLALEERQPFLALYDANGRVRTRLSLDILGDPKIAVYDRDGKALGGLGISLGKPLLFLESLEKGQPTASVSIEPDVLRFSDTKTKAQVELGMIGLPLGYALFGPSLTFDDGKGNALLNLSRGKPILILSDAQGFKATVGSDALKDPRTGTVQQRSASSLILSDSSGKIIWSAP